MPDEIDQAQAYNDDFQAFALVAHRRRREPVSYTGTDCLECEKEIPLARRQAVPGCRFCIDCQTSFEMETTR